MNTRSSLACRPAAGSIGVLVATAVVTSTLAWAPAHAAVPLPPLVPDTGTGTSVPLPPLVPGTGTGTETSVPLPPLVPVPGPGTGEPLPGTCEVGIADCTPPVTKLSGKPGVKTSSRSTDGAGATSATTAAFAFRAFEPVEGSDPPTASTTPTEDATFECKLVKLPATTPDFASCPGTTAGSASYTGLTDGTYEFAVRASDAAGNKDATPETFRWTVDTTAPTTVLTSRPTSWVLARRATFGLDVTAPDEKSDVSFQCYLDGAGRQCPTVAFSSGTHTFRAVATDHAGNTDRTGVSHTFTMPVNNLALAHSKGWTQAKVKGAFLHTASITKKKGAKVATRTTGTTEIALVASKGRGFGTVVVKLGSKTLKKVSLAGRKGVTKQLIPVASFSSPVSGTVTVQVVSQGKRVVVEGLGLTAG